MAAAQAFVYFTLGVLSIRNEKINPRQPTNVTCVIRTDNIERDSQNIQLTTGSNPVCIHFTVHTLFVTPVVFKKLTVAGAVNRAWVCFHPLLGQGTSKLNLSQHKIWALFINHHLFFEVSGKTTGL